MNSIWSNRYFLVFLTLRDIKIRYKQTGLGIVWAGLSPLLQVLVYALVFGVFFNIRTGNSAYFPTVFAGFIFWNFFAQAVSSACYSITSNANLVTKVPFPKIVLPISSIFARLPDLLVSIVILLIILFFYHIPVTITALWLIPVFVTELVLIFGLSLLISSLNVFFRDIALILPLVITIWMFLTPVIYPLSSVPERYQMLLGLNPLTGILEGIRGALFSGEIPGLVYFFSAAIMSVLVTFFGLRVFTILEPRMSDEI